MNEGQETHSHKRRSVLAGPTWEVKLKCSKGWVIALPPTLWGHSWYLHGHAEVHHGDTGVAVPAHVHHSVATVGGLALQRGAWGTEVILWLLVSHCDLIRGFCRMWQKAFDLCSPGGALLWPLSGSERAWVVGGTHSDVAEDPHAATCLLGSHPVERPTSPSAREPLTHFGPGPTVLTQHMDGLIF